MFVPGTTVCPSLLPLLERGSSAERHVSADRQLPDDLDHQTTGGIDSGCGGNSAPVLFVGLVSRGASLHALPNFREGVTHFFAS